ncbi:MAG: TolC family outer membrane protein [Gammaproteobacteria bacterium]|nr:TolC family outer membrane protein [Gammaproteobacteria bacterium]
MKGAILAIAALLLHTIQTVSAAEATAVDLTTLEGVVRHTLSTNPVVLGRRDARRAADEGRTQAFAGYLPTLDLTIGLGRERTDDPSTRLAGDGDVYLDREEANLTLSQMLFDGFRTRSEVARSEALIASAATGFANTAEDNAMRATEAFLEVLRRREIVDITERNVATHRDILEKIRARSGGGAGNKADVQQTLGRLALAESRLSRARRDVRNAEANFERVVGPPPGRLVRPEPPRARLPEDRAATLRRANEEHPRIETALAELEAARATRDATRSAFFPRVDLELSVNENEDIDGVEGDNNDTRLMAVARYNLYRGGADAARHRQAAHDISRAMNRVADERRVTAEEVNLEWNAWDTSRERIPFLLSHVEASEQVLQAYLEQFNIGQRTLLDVLDSENELLSARVSYITGLYTEMLGVYRVLRALGGLAPGLGIDLPEGTRYSARVE